MILVWLHVAFLEKEDSRSLYLVVFSCSAGQTVSRREHRFSQASGSWEESAMMPSDSVRYQSVWLAMLLGYHNDPSLCGIQYRSTVCCTCATVLQTITVVVVVLLYRTSSGVRPRSSIHVRQANQYTEYNRVVLLL